MSNSQTLEERLAAVEQQVRELKQENASTGPKHNWLDKIKGTFKDDPEFGEILRLGQGIRQRAFS